MALVPRAANLLTLAVLVASTWWSGAQRPADVAASAAQAPAMPATTAAAPLRDVAGTTTSAKQWPLQANTLPRDGLQAVGYQPHATR